jgi:hypothetical protein
MVTTRLSFTIDAANADALQRLAGDFRVPVARVLRDAVRLLLDQEPQYRVTLLERLGYALPTPEQAAASARLIAAAALVDLSDLIAARMPPLVAFAPERGTNFVVGRLIPKNSSQNVRGVCTGSRHALP